MRGGRSMRNLPFRTRFMTTAFFPYRALPHPRPAGAPSRREPKSCWRFIRQYGPPFAIGGRSFSGRRGRRPLRGIRKFCGSPVRPLHIPYQGPFLRRLSFLNVGTGVLNGPKTMVYPVPSVDVFAGRETRPLQSEGKPAKNVLGFVSV